MLTIVKEPDEPMEVPAAPAEALCPALKSPVTFAEAEAEAEASAEAFTANIFGKVMEPKVGRALTGELQRRL